MGDDEYDEFTPLGEDPYDSQREDHIVRKQMKAEQDAEAKAAAEDAEKFPLYTKGKDGTYNVPTGEYEDAKGKVKKYKAEKDDEEYDIVEMWEGTYPSSGHQERVVATVTGKKELRERMKEYEEEEERDPTVAFVPKKRIKEESYEDPHFDDNLGGQTRAAQEADRAYERYQKQHYGDD